MSTPFWRYLSMLISSAVILTACGPGSSPTSREESLAEPGQTLAPTHPPQDQEPTRHSMGDEDLSSEEGAMQVGNGEVEITSGGLGYQSYFASPVEGGPYPGIILIHSFNGLEPGYISMTDQFASEGFVVLAIGWQTHGRSPSDETVRQLVLEGVDYLKGREDVQPDHIGLTGFCAGGRYTMLFLPQLEIFDAGVAWYGFPYSGETQPAELVPNLDAPMLIIHGTGDAPSPIDDIYRYATSLDEAGVPFELKVYSGEPHGFMLSDGEMREDEVARDAFDSMVRFFHRKLR